MVVLPGSNLFPLVHLRVSQRSQKWPLSKNILRKPLISVQVARLFFVKVPVKMFWNKLSEKKKVLASFTFPACTLKCNFGTFILGLSGIQVNANQMHLERIFCHQFSNLSPCKRLSDKQYRHTMKVKNPFFQTAI